MASEATQEQLETISELARQACAISDNLNLGSADPTRGEIFRLVQSCHQANMNNRIQAENMQKAATDLKNLGAGMPLQGYNQLGGYRPV